MRKAGLIVTAVLVLAGAAIAQDEYLATMKFLVIKDFNGKPIRNASVVLHPVAKNGKQEKGGLQVKCDADGKASYDGVPYGKIRVQVLATGFQTFGQDYDIDQPVEEITIRMKRPQEQFSIYTDKPADKKGEAPAPEKKDESDKQTKDKPQ
jgi:Carboxypeptidase regulatory-like domain